MNNMPLVLWMMACAALFGANANFATPAHGRLVQNNSAESHGSQGLFDRLKGPWKSTDNRAGLEEAADTMIISRVDAHKIKITFENVEGRWSEVDHISGSDKLIGAERLWDSDNKKYIEKHHTIYILHLTRTRLIWQEGDIKQGAGEIRYWRRISKG